MKVEFLQHNITKLLSQKNAAYGLVGILAVSNVLLSINSFYKAERFYFIPPKIDRPFSVAGKDVSKEYLEQLSYYVSLLILNTTSASQPYQHQQILKWTSPEGYSSLKSRLNKETEIYKNLQLTTSFHPTKILASPDSLEVHVTGNLVSAISGNKVKESVETLHIKFRTTGAGIYIESVKGVPEHVN